jgi:hypothetical protein
MEADAAFRGLEVLEGQAYLSEKTMRHKDQWQTLKSSGTISMVPAVNLLLLSCRLMWIFRSGRFAAD